LTFLLSGGRTAAALNALMKSIAQRFRLRTLTSLVSLALASQLAWAVEPFKLRDIRVEGLQRVEPGTVFASLPVRVGDTYSDDKGAGAIRALFGLGLFTDVRLDVNGDVLVVVVRGAPHRGEVDLSPASRSSMQRGAARPCAMWVWPKAAPMTRRLADRAEQELKRQYINRSLYGAQVVTTVTPDASATAST
jgi:outer membrane protein insertion porin family